MENISINPGTSRELPVVFPCLSEPWHVIVEKHKAAASSVHFRLPREHFKKIGGL
jgi:hypothetical protein